MTQSSSGFSPIFFRLELILPIFPQTSKLMNEIDFGLNFLHAELFSELLCEGLRAEDYTQKGDKLKVIMLRASQICNIH